MTFESFWDRSYRDGSYLEHWEAPKVPPELVALAASGALPAGGTALDIGCGSGLEAVFLARTGESAEEKGDGIVDEVAQDQERRQHQIPRHRLADHR